MRSSYAYAYAYVAVMSSEDMDGISISERLSANQQPLYAYANHVLTRHNSDISIAISTGGISIGAVVRALASHQCGLGSILAQCHVG